MARILLVRHGESEWNAQRRWQGHHDVPLNDRGEQQAKLAAHQLAVHLGEQNIQGLAASDLSRAQRTAEIIGSVLGNEHVHIDQRLRERHVGEWTGLTEAEVDAAYPGMLAAWRRGELERIPGGETGEEVLARVLDALHDLAARHTEDSWLVAVTHGGVIRLIEQHLELELGRIGNLCGRWVQLEAGAIRGGDAFLFDAEATTTL